ncbi:hypothetical protein M9458_047194, partial [Cirrhinus mrigala]
NKVAPLQPASETDVADPQCGPSGLEPTAPSQIADPQPGPSDLEPTSIQDHTEPQPGPSSVTPTNCDENPADPEPAEEDQTNTKKKKKKHICGFFRRTWRAVKRAATQCKKHNKPDTDAAVPQPDPNVHEPMALQDPAVPQPDQTNSAALQDLTEHPEDPKPDSSDSDQDSDDDSLPGPSGLELVASEYPEMEPVSEQPVSPIQLL